MRCGLRGRRRRAGAERLGVMVTAMSFTSYNVYYVNGEAINQHFQVDQRLMSSRSKFVSLLAPICTLFRSNDVSRPAEPNG